MVNPAELQPFLRIRELGIFMDQTALLFKFPDSGLIGFHDRIGGFGFFRGSLNTRLNLMVIAQIGDLSGNVVQRTPDTGGHVGSLTGQRSTVIATGPVTGFLGLFGLFCFGSGVTVTGQQFQGHCRVTIPVLTKELAGRGLVGV